MRRDADQVADVRNRRASIFLPINPLKMAKTSNARRFEVLAIFPVSARQFGIKDMLGGPAGVEDFLRGIVWVVTRVV